MLRNLSGLCEPEVSAGFSPGRLHMGGYGGGQVQGDKALIGGTHKGGHRPYGGEDLTLIDYTIN